MLNLPDLFMLINDPIQDQVGWLIIPMNVSSNIPKFNGKSRGDHSTHIMTFDLSIFGVS